MSAGAATTTGGEGPGGPTPPGELSGAIGATSADTSKAGTGEPPSATGTVSPPGPPVAGSSTPDEPVQSEGTGAATTAAGTTLPQPLIQPGAEQRTRPRDGSRIAIVGEIVYELGPDGRTLREIPYFEYAREALGDHCPSVDSLRQRWLHPEQRAELEGLLADAGVELPELAAALDLADRDAVDVLAGAIFKQTVPTRQERVERLRREHSDWLDGFTPPAREILEAVLEKYVAGEAAHITDTGLLKVPPLAERGTFMELAQHFGGGAALRAALEELQSRLYAP